MGKQPYIPLYIGDWEKDTNTLSLEAEGALLKLIFKLWDSPARGQLSISFSQLSIMLKKAQDMTEKILQELHENKVLNIEFTEHKIVKIQSRRMLKDLEKSKSYSDRGKKGGRPKKANQKLNESKSKANSDNDIDNVNENKKNKKPAENLVFPFDSEEFLNLWDAWVQYRIDLKKPYHTFSAKQAALQELGKYPEETANEMIKQAIRCEWKDIHKLNENGKQGSTNSKNADVDELVRQAAGHIAGTQNRNNPSGGTG